MKPTEFQNELMRLQTQLKGKDAIIEKLEYMVELLSSLNKSKEERLRTLERKIECQQIISQINFN